ncbi:solute carrier family 22 member 7-like [Schistocerca gregaria]|uniref:solute carrier family 22 member 7-like n=1 Tax=Schistocerca gregaria TaxID=7010 RepID=UPI00211EF5C6|nr:solute carrier family 22 member 7-like [Schistocerca gregaria]
MVCTTSSQGKQDANIPVPEDSTDPGIESIIQQAGGFGRFQKLFLFIYNFLLPCAMGMNYVNIVMALTAPDHWCHVPGRDEANLTVDQWKTLTLPRKANIYSRCSMYADPEENPHNIGSSIEENITECQFGWEYDRTWYTQTAVSQHNWVCNDAIKASIALSLSSLGQAVGLLVFGQLSDVVGRRPVFHVAAVCVLLGRIGCVFSSDIYWLFAAAIFLGGSSYGACYSTTLTLAGELVPSSKRGLVTMTQLTGWAAGHMAAPLVALLLPDWRHFTAATGVSVAPFLLAIWWFPESPRWLAVHGSAERALSQLQAIAKSNGCQLPPDTERVLHKLASRRERVYGVPSLFATRDIAITTTLTCVAGTTMMVLYDSTLLTMTNAVDNSPVLNLVVQAAIEVPAYMAGRVASDRMGRKPALYCSLLALAILNTCSAAIAGWDVVWAEMTLLALSKAFICAAFCPLHVLALETFPTCLRQTGISFYSMLGAAASVASPYLVFQGQNKDVQIPFLVMSALASIGSLPAFFLKETRKRQMPETLADVHRMKKALKVRKLSAPDLTAEYVNNGNVGEDGNSQRGLP